MYETVRIVNKLKPKFVIWENVKNILSQKHRHNFDNYLTAMENLGYINYYQILNAKDYGIPQNRERVFTISILKSSATQQNDYETLEKLEDFNFPSKQELKIKLKDILEPTVDEKYYLNDRQIRRIKTTTYITGQRRIQEKDWVDTLCARDWKDPKCVQVAELDIKQVVKIRKLTPKEYWRLMGFTDEEFEKAAKLNSNTQLYKQAGNSIVVNVLVEIFKNLFRGDDNAER